jgi:hypothetical protein
LDEAGLIHRVVIRPALLLEPFAEPCAADMPDVGYLQVGEFDNAAVHVRLAAQSTFDFKWSYVVVRDDSI